MRCADLSGCLAVYCTCTVTNSVHAWTVIRPVSLTVHLNVHAHLQVPIQCRCGLLRVFVHLGGCEACMGRVLVGCVKAVHL